LLSETREGVLKPGLYDNIFDLHQYLFFKKKLCFQGGFGRFAVYPDFPAAYLPDLGRFAGDQQDFRRGHSYRHGRIQQVILHLPGNTGVIPDILLYPVLVPIARIDERAVILDPIRSAPGAENGYNYK